MNDKTELAALREELDGYRAANMVLRDELKTERLRADAAVGDANDAERSLAAAEQRNATLENLVRQFQGVAYGGFLDDAHLLRMQRDIDAALTKPTESGASE